MMAISDRDIVPEANRFPYCIVWTPIPCLTWFFPFIGHMGIATSKGVIRDFAGSFYVAEDDMGFGWPTRYLQLSPENVEGGADVFDRCIQEASETYKERMHNLICDNCHSHVALALNSMNYMEREDWNMVNLAILILTKGSYVRKIDILSQWLPFLIIISMVRLTAEFMADRPQFVNTLNMRELNLRGCKIPVIENMGVTRDQFDLIDFTDNDIRKLDNFPNFKRLSVLYLHNNRINYIAPDIGAKLPNLKTLVLTNNNICELGDIDPLANCEKLEYVTFIGNPITHKENYRLYIIYKLSTVRVIDFNRVRLSEREAAKMMFKGKSGKKARDAIQRSVHTDDVTEKENNATPGSNLTDDDKAKIKEAIKNAKSLAEVNYLQSILASGKVPEKGWNRQLMDQNDEQQQQEQNGNGFVEEMKT
ncbi:unnamed protein product [Caenorhabditis bovis]|uniref:Probable U2 small nuclear ribonucleoprotein A' n=1 Tax=Caenorhabditis bovis TaxID=2654633 RepID=A0A8S1EXF5_9PELO|nr:unnamed protein product [Caenorhabditis bovis]